jgi:enoyl-CoA hydratase
MSIDYALGDDHVVTITINRPEARNSMDMEHFFQLRSAWDRFGEDDDAYVAIITGRTSVSGPTSRRTSRRSPSCRAR